jgi:hypothetical protein
MGERSRIGIVYRDRAPELVAGGIPDGMPWEAEFFEEREVLAEGLEARERLRRGLLPG